MNIETSQQPPAVFIMGPTASGKTRLAMELFDRLPCELISVDSALIYRGMDIGTAKPTADELSRYPHRLIDICDPAESYSVANFRADALAAMEEVVAAGRIPVLVGGTMLYFKALIDGLASMPAASPELRRRIEEEFDRDGPDRLYAELLANDPRAAAGLHPNNRQRLVRALEVLRLTGQPISHYWQQGNGSLPAEEISADLADASVAIPYTVVQFAIAPQQRAALHDRINQRFELMLAEGFLREVAQLRQRPDLHPGLPSIRCVGYRQAWDHLDGLTDYETMSEQGKAATRQLAKRQLTWLRKWRDLHWLDTNDRRMTDQALKIIANRLTLK